MDSRESQQPSVALNAPKVSWMERVPLVFFQWSKRLAVGAFGLASLLLILAGVIGSNAWWHRHAPSPAPALTPTASRRPAARVDFPTTNPPPRAWQDLARRGAIVHAVENEDSPVAAVTLPEPPASRATTGPIAAPAPTPNTPSKAPLPGAATGGPRAVAPTGVGRQRGGTNGLLAFVQLRCPVLHQTQLRDGTQQRNLLDLPGAICPHSEFVKRQISPRLAILSYQTNAWNATSQLTLLDGVYREAIRRDHRSISILGGLVAVGGTPNGSHTLHLFWLPF